MRISRIEIKINIDSYIILKQNAHAYPHAYICMYACRYIYILTFIPTRFAWQAMAFDLIAAECPQNVLWRGALRRIALRRFALRQSTKG